MPPRDVIYPVPDATYPTHTDSTSSHSPTMASESNDDTQITPPEYSLLPESLSTELIAGAGSNLSNPPMSMTVPPVLPLPAFFTKESVQIYYTQIKQTSMFYGLRMPYLSEFVRRCSVAGPLDQQPSREFLEDVHFSNEFNWDKYDAMVWKLTQTMPSNVSLIFDRLKVLFNNVLDQTLVSKYPEGYRMPVKHGFAHDFKRILTLLGLEVEKRQTSDVLEVLMRLMERIYTTAYEKHLKQKPSDVSLLEYDHASPNVVVQFNGYKKLLLSKTAQFEALANGNWPFGRPSSTNSKSSTLHVTKWL